MDIGQLKRVIEEYTGTQDLTAGDDTSADTDEGAEQNADLFTESEEEEYE